jgi:glycosyltransferase involved in cell wall biosynthesis
MMYKNNTLPVSLIIPTHNREMKLCRLLHSLETLSAKPYEIIIINDGSNDGTEEKVSEWLDSEKSLSKKLINIPHSKGPANARNKGILFASQTLVAFTDDDVVVTPHWLKRLVEKIIHSDPSIAGVGGRVLPLNKDILSQYYSEIRLLDPPKNLQYIVTANACFKKDIISKVGLFNNSFTFAGGEDTELCFRLRKMKYRFLFQRDAVVYHDYSSNFLDFCKTWIRYGKGTGRAIKAIERA